VLRSGESEFRLPDIIAAGCLLRPIDSLNVTVDYRRVRYSQLAKGLTSEDTSDFFVDDGNEVRAGVEYLRFAGSNTFALRGGVWYDPDHRIQYRGPFVWNQVTHPAGDDELHYTGGAGFVVKNTVQIDGGYDYSARVKTVSLSAIYRF
jgi:long-subunit fatty acid transport protein